MNSTQKFDVAFAVVFGILGIVAAIAVILGATHQWLMLAISAIIVAVLINEYKQESQKKK